ncbi:MBL fold metallo-hydrolase [Runella slithyformis]|uniref:Metallo-beta-lactamase superfamily protein n=1 Tax=Runella slithyformis (strain ATCC 29530 / DSM 19594 / LMG 11500 / NCIMB 11436 / LSU 4) TaxID=761193 RepID=A0A7U4E4R8_RUNSL|nr:MBL fold metallo-hydrolase [Runella slithyformis]AEI47703.1 putative metallo-beta-lactamase superfamily protein [Runella slithyformis DSM 19594]
MVSKPTAVTYRIFSSGYCTAHDWIVDPKNGRGKARFYATWLLLEHPREGLYLFDTGYSARFLEAARHFPDTFYGWATPTFIKEEETAVYQLAQLGIRPSDLSGMIISHFHADHAAGMLDFPEIPIICHPAALEQVLSVNGVGAVRHGIVKALIPRDLKERVRRVDDNHPEGFGRVDAGESFSLQFMDLFGDGSVELVHLPGHARGQLGLRIHTADHTLFFATDAAWRKSTLEAGTLPNPVVRLFFDDWKAYKTTFAALQAYSKTFPAHRLIFTHCPQTMDFID